MPVQEKNTDQVNILATHFVKRTEGVQKTTANKTIYISTTGNDSGGNGTSDNPFATLLHVWNNILPLVVNHTINIQFVDGTYTLASNWDLKQKIGTGTININGNSSSRSSVVISGNSNTYRILITGCNLYQVTIKDLTIQNMERVEVDSARYINISNIVSKSHTLDGVRFDFGSSGLIANSDFSLNANNGIYGLRGSSIYSNNNTSTAGNNTLYGLRAAFHGNISKAGASQPGGATAAENTVSGGSIA